MACAGTRGGATLPTGSHGDKAKEPPVDITKAELPFTILDAGTSHQVPEAAFWDKLATERAVCVGEEHSNPHHHWVQLHVVTELAKRWKTLALGMEMFQRPFQGVLDDYAGGRIDGAALRSRAGWEDRWGYDYGFYGPTIDVAVGAHATLLALNAAKELTKKIAHHGLEALTPDEKVQVPQLDLGDTAHRAWFDALMEEMGGDAHTHGGDKAAAMPSDDRVYTVQVVWDETMADTATKWLVANPEGHLVILAGTGHCHDSAIVHRIQRRGIADVVSLRTVLDDGDGGVAEALAKPINDYLVVLAVPKSVEAPAKP